MLEPHNPEAIQNYGWSQIKPIQLQVVRQILPKNLEACKITLKILSKYESFAPILIKFMNTDLANNLANANGIAILM
jgi:hypothetical protein